MKVLLLLIISANLFFQCEKFVSDSEISETILVAEIIQKKMPVFVGSNDNNIIDLKLKVDPPANMLEISQLTIHFSSGSKINCLSEVSVFYFENEKATNFGSSKIISNELKITGKQVLQKGENVFSIYFKTKNDAELLSTFQVEQIDILYSDSKVQKVKNEKSGNIYLAKVLRAAGQDGCDTYRIPGLIATSNGTLIAVYDNRYNNSKDLQENIDIGMSRSTNGGQTWEPMRVIMDMGKWGGNPESLNGIGDPCVMYDEKNATIWVAALWMSGASEKDMLWWASKPGLKPSETGQFILVKSTDDGLTWSKPINITEQIKDPAWQLLLQGPGRGISMKNGTLVFPAQFKKDIGEKSLDGGQYTCHSTIVYSTDGGENWQIGSGSKTNTTEAQVVELPDGTLMLNMRDDRNRKDKSETNGRAVAVTKDLGKTWEKHPTSNSALPEPNCMASLISAEIIVDGTKKHALFFSNPNNKNERKNMTVKASLDDGLSWPLEFQVELNEAGGYGYSCLTMLDESTIGILYEGVKDLYFQKIRVEDILKK